MNFKEDKKKHNKTNKFSMVFSGGYHNALLVGLSRLGHWDSREAEAHTSLNLPEQ
jgi:hypothetical protein